MSAIRPSPNPRSRPLRAADSSSGGRSQRASASARRPRAVSVGRLAADAENRAGLCPTRSSARTAATWWHWDLPRCGIPLGRNEDGLPTEARNSLRRPTFAKATVGNLRLDRARRLEEAAGVEPRRSPRHQQVSQELLAQCRLNRSKCRVQVQNRYSTAVSRSSLRPHEIRRIRICDSESLLHGCSHGERLR
jgi:hypothetical protein